MPVLLVVLYADRYHADPLLNNSTDSNVTHTLNLILLPVKQLDLDWISVLCTPLDNVHIAIDFLDKTHHHRSGRGRRKRRASQTKTQINEAFASPRAA